MSNIVPLWDYSCNIYSQPDVETACLLLQDHYDIDVPLLLFLCWAGVYYATLLPQHVEQAQQISQQWSANCIALLRDIRKRMQQQPPTADIQSHWQEVRASVKKAELSAEKRLLVSLEQFLSDQGQLLAPDAVSHDPTRLIDSILNNVLALYPVLLQSPAAIAAMGRVVHAAQSHIQYDDVLELANNRAK